MENENEDLEKLISRVNFYESSVDQLKKEIPKYLAKQSELDKHHKSFAKVLRAVGSSEPNQKLQNALFLYASNQDALVAAITNYEACEHKANASIEDSRKLIISPIREVIADVSETIKKSTIASSPRNSMKPFAQSTLPVHVKLFEKYRLKSMTTLLTNLVETELRYHCKAVEELSSVISLLKKIDDNDPTY
mmetsp:Transcript_14016/g.20948  ORF Transcript_14016/g.20948 Transcript_14016/m.20948 type:complete len:192 (-) Transcript_14016:124-699(-)